MSAILITKHLSLLLPLTQDSVVLDLTRPLSTLFLVFLFQERFAYIHNSFTLQIHTSIMKYLMQALIKHH